MALAPTKISNYDAVGTMAVRPVGFSPASGDEIVPVSAAVPLPVTAVVTGSAAVTGPMTSAEFLANMRSTATHSSVSSAASSTTILAANASRKGARIFNSDANALYLDLSGGTAVAASRAQVKLATDEGYDVPFGLTGTITGVWAADGAGAASVVEFA